MKVWIAKDWTGTYVFADKPKLLEKLSSFPPTWTGHKLKEFNLENSFYEDELQCGECVERNICWSIVQIIK